MAEESKPEAPAAAAGGEPAPAAATEAPAAAPDPAEISLYEPDAKAGGEEAPTTEEPTKPDAPAPEKKEDASAKGDKPATEPEKTASPAELALENLRKKREEFKAKAEPERKVRELEQEVKDLKAQLSGAKPATDFEALRKQDPIKAAEAAAGMSLADLVDLHVDRGEGKAPAGGEAEAPAWAKQLATRLESLEQENAGLKAAADKAKQEADQRANAASAEEIQRAAIKTVETWTTEGGDRFLALSAKYSPEAIYNSFRGWLTRHKVQIENDAEAKELFLPYADELEARERDKSLAIAEKIGGKKVSAQGSQKIAEDTKANAKNGSKAGVTARASKGAPPNPKGDDDLPLDPVKRAEIVGQEISFYEEDA